MKLVAKKDLNKRIGRDLMRLRKLYRLSQETLGNELGLHQSAICRIEDGEQELSAAEFVKLRAYFDSLPNLFRDEV